MNSTSDIDFQTLSTLYRQEKKEKEALKVELMKMQLQLQKFAQMVFGSKSERFIPLISVRRKSILRAILPKQKKWSM